MNPREYFTHNYELDAVIYRCLQYLPESYFNDHILYIWETGGLLRPQWDEHNCLMRSWLNVVAHMAVSATLGYNLVLGTRKLGASPSLVVKALLLHDWFKRCEQTKEDVDKEDDSRLLLKMGVSEDVVSLTKATGDIGLERMMTGNASLEEMVVFYADCCTSNYQVVTYRRRFDDLKPHFEEGGRYFHAGQDFIRKHGKPHREVYDSVVIPLEKRLAGLLGHSKEQELIPLIYSPKFVHGEV